MARESDSGKCTTSVARSKVARTRQSASGLLSSCIRNIKSAVGGIPISLFVFCPFAAGTRQPITSTVWNLVRFPGEETMPFS